MYLLPSEQKKRITKNIEQFNQTGKLSILEPCDCGNHVQHNNGGNYHDEIYLRCDEGQVFIKRETTCELVPRAEWEPCDDWEKVIQDNADWLN